MISRRLKKFYKIKYSKIEESFLISYNFTWKIKLENSKIPNSEFQKFEKIYICLKTRLNSKIKISNSKNSFSPRLSPHTFQKQSYPPSTLNLREIAGYDRKTPMWNTS